MATLWYHTAYAIHRLPGPVARFAFRLAQGLMRRLECRRGRHLRAGSANYCDYGCGTLLNRAGWRWWTVRLRDGSSRVVQATSEAHARNLVMFGEATRGQVNTDALIAQRHVVHEVEIVSCTAGQIVDK